MNEEIFKQRTKQLGLQVLLLDDELPRKRSTDTIARQLFRAATSVGANYRAACRGRSTADVLSKLGIVEEEAGETILWLEMLADSGAIALKRVSALIKEADEILAMTVASIKTLRRKNG